MILFSVLLLDACTLWDNPTPSAAPASPLTGSGATETAQSAAEIAPSFENFTDLGLAHSKAGRHEQALEAFERAIQINSKAALGHNNLCAEFNALKRWFLAIPHCQKALELEPQFVLAQNNLVVSNQLKLTQEMKIETLKSALHLNSNTDRHTVDLGQEYYIQGDYLRAIKTWEQVLESSPLFPSALSNMAAAHIFLKRFSEAEAHLQRAIKLAPLNPLFQNNLKWLIEAKAREN